MKLILLPLTPLLLLAVEALRAAESTAQNTFHVTLPAPSFADALRPDSPFGINTAFHPGTPDLDARLRAMQQAGIKWGRQDFSWGRIEKEKGKYEWEAYDRLVDSFTKRGILLFGNLNGSPAFHDPRTSEGVAAYCAFAREAVRRFAGKVDYWQIWNEPNGGYWKGTPEQYAALLAAAGKAIHETSPKAKVLALNMAFCDVLWAEAEHLGVPICFHPAPNNYAQDHFVNRFLTRPSTTITSGLNNPVELMSAVASMTVGGVLQRFPGLRVGFLEGSCSWLPWLLWRLDEYWEMSKGGEDVQLDDVPSGYFRRQCFISVEPDEHLAKWFIEELGDELLVFSTDYPHSDSRFPQAVETFLGLDISTRSKEKILWDNCARLYGIG